MPATFEPRSAQGMNDPALYMAAVDFSEKRVEFWEQQVHACLGLLAQGGALCTDEMRRTLEGMELDARHASLDYYSRWTIAMASLLMEKGLLSEADLDRELGEGAAGTQPAAEFEVGDSVLVRPLDGPTALSRSMWRRPHIRTPGYIFGEEGTIERRVGSFPNPSLRAYGKEGGAETLYRVRFLQTRIWEAAGLEYSGAARDTVDVEVGSSFPEAAAAALHVDRKIDSRLKMDADAALNRCMPTG